MFNCNVITLENATVIVNATLFEGSSSVVQRPEEIDMPGDLSAAEVVNAAVAAGSWPPGNVPEILSPGCVASTNENLFRI